ncbi:MAG TPA: hypothetical protein VFB72_18695 [Verrucomicrobiae bacterium]|nr:hypothetical protein [Verrucomicrobiae bacterium]
MQRHVDERLAAMKAQIPPDDPSTHNLLFLVFRAYGLESTFLKSVPVLIGDWNLHKASGKKDIEYLNGLNAKLNAWRAAIAAVAPRN